jgi:hypothetical protein
MGPKKPEKGSLMSAFKKAAFCVLASATLAMGAAGVAQAGYEGDPNYNREVASATQTYDSRVGSIDSQKQAQQAQCASTGVNGLGNQARNFGNAKDGWAKATGVLGAIGSGANAKACSDRASASAEQQRAMASDNLQRQLDNINSRYERSEKLKQSRFVQQAGGGAVKVSPQAADPIAKACQDATIQAIRSGKPLNETQKEMCHFHNSGGPKL